MLNISNGDDTRRSSSAVWARMWLVPRRSVGGFNSYLFQRRLFEWRIEVVHVMSHQRNIKKGFWFACSSTNRSVFSVSEKVRLGSALFKYTAEGFKQCFSNGCILSIFITFFGHASAEHSDIVQLSFFMLQSRLLRLCNTVLTNPEKCFFFPIFGWVCYFLIRKVTALEFNPPIVT